MHPNYRGLGLLLSLGSLPIACTKDDEDTDSSLPSSTDPKETEGATSGSTTKPGTSATSGPTDTGESGTDTMPTTSTTTDDTGEDLPVNPGCQAYSDHYVECFPAYANQGKGIAARCTFYRNLGQKTDGAACVTAYDAYYVCLTMVPCGALKLEPPNQPCKAEQQAEIEACPSTV